MSEPTANVEEPPCAPSSICSKVAKVMCLGFLVFVLYNGINAHEAERREDELDRQMLRLMYAKMFGKEDSQIKSFSQDILKLIGKF